MASKKICKKFCKKTPKPGRPKATAKCKNCGHESRTHRAGNRLKKGRKGLKKGIISALERYRRQMDIDYTPRSNPSHYPSMAALRACQAVSKSKAKTKQAILRVIRKAKLGSRKRK